MFDIIAPETAPQVYTPPFDGVQHPLAPEVVAAVSKNGKQPVSFWRVINTLANEQNAKSRAHRRSWRLRYLCAVRELARAGVLFRHGSLISTSDFATTPRPRRPRRVSRSVEGLANDLSGSRLTQTSAAMLARIQQIPERELIRTTKVTLTRHGQSKSALPSPLEASSAAAALARRPRTRKIWSGWIGSTRSYCGMPIRLLATGENVFAFGALRGRVVWSRERGDLTDPIGGAGIDWGVVRSSGVEIDQNPHAAILGRLKAGKVERQSEAKARAARLNGSTPCGPGKRRGRQRAARQ
jgi:hypothetical protein